MAKSLKNRVAIVGVAESDLGKVEGKDACQLQAEAARTALAEAGLKLKDVDGIFAHTGGRFPAALMAEYLGVQPTYIDGTDVGGPSNLMHIMHAAAAIEAGLCSVALIMYGSTQRSDSARTLGGVADDPRSPRGQYEMPYGMFAPLGHYAMAARRHMHEYGTKPEQMAAVAVAARKWANMNPKAYMKGPLTVEEVLASPIVSDPLRKFDCCLVTDGGGAIVVTAADRARDLKSKPVLVSGMAEGGSHHFFSAGRESLTRSNAVNTGRRAFEMAGMTHKDIDVVQIYDSFTITVMLTLEDLGFCKPGESGAFVSGGRIEPGGAFPLNTSGGGLSYCHPGMFGTFLVVEGVRQLRGDCGERQVKGAKTALCHGTGLVLSTQSTLILSTE